MKTTAIVNLKGGVGKTVTAISMATILASELEYRVLLIEADAQGNATKLLLPDGDYNTLALLLAGEEADYTQLIYRTAIRNLDVLPADMDLMRADLSALETGRYSINALRDLMDCLAEDDAYDYVIIDCPPSFSAACAAAIAASSSIIIPLKLDMFAVSGMRELTAQIDGVRRIHPNVRVGGCLVTMWYNSESLRRNEALLRTTAPVPVYGTVIRRTPKVDESTWAREPVLTWSPRSAAAVDYRLFVSEYLAEEAKNDVEQNKGI